MEVKKTDNKTQNVEKQLAWYKAFFDNATDAVFIIEPDTWTVLDANICASEMMKLKKNDLIGSALPQFRRIFKLLNKSDSPVVLSELTLYNADDIEIMIEVSSRYIDFDGQRLIQAIARDVSEQRIMTDKLLQTDKLVLLGQLSAGISHEIRNPLSAVNLNLQTLERDLPKDSPDLEKVKIALQGVERISKIVEKTLSFSRTSIPEIKGLDINTQLRSTLDLLSSQLSKKRIEIDFELDEDLPEIAADSKQMQQVFINLMTNSIDAIDGTGKIKIRTFVEMASRERESDYVVISISDSGTGINAEDLSKVFNPFFTRKAEGTGLGLPITQRIVYNHNGIIDIESIVGKGTTFYIKLPVVIEN
jgi:signal transduction histidine kinase